MQHPVIIPIGAIGSPVKSFQTEKFGGILYLGYPSVDPGRNG